MLIRFSKFKNKVFEVTFDTGTFGYREVNCISKNIVETDKEGVCVYKTEGTIPKYLYFLSNNKFALYSKQEVERNKNLESVYRFTENRIKIKPTQILRKAIVANIGPIKGYSDPKYLKENLNSILQKYFSINSFLCDAIFLIEAGYKKYEREDLSFIDKDRGICTLMVENKDGNTGISVLHRPDIKILSSNKINSKISIIHGPDSNKGLNQNALQSFKSRVDNLNTPFIIGDFNFEFSNEEQSTQSANSYAIKCKEYLKSVGYKYYTTFPIFNQKFVVDGMVGKSSYAPFSDAFMVLKNGHQVFEVDITQYGNFLYDLKIQKENIPNSTTSLDKNKIIKHLNNFKTLFKLTKLTSEDKDVQQEIKENSYNYTLIANAQLRSSLSKYDDYGQYEYGYIAQNNDIGKIVFISYENGTISNEESFEKIKQKLEDRS